MDKGVPRLHLFGQSPTQLHGQSAQSITTRQSTTRSITTQLFTTQPIPHCGQIVPQPGIGSTQCTTAAPSPTRRRLPQPTGPNNEKVETMIGFDFHWRSQRDSNPRAANATNTLAGCPFRPLRHDSTSHFISATGCKHSSPPRPAQIAVPLRVPPRSQSPTIARNPAPAFPTPRHRTRIFPRHTAASASIRTNVPLEYGA